MTLLSTFKLTLLPTLWAICSKTLRVLHHLPAFAVQISVCGLVPLERQAILGKHVDLNRHIGGV